MRKFKTNIDSLSFCLKERSFKFFQGKFETDEKEVAERVKEVPGVEEVEGAIDGAIKVNDDIKKSMKKAEKSKKPSKGAK